MTAQKTLTTGDATAALLHAEQLAERWTAELTEKQHAADLQAAELADIEARAGDILLDDDGDHSLQRMTDELLRRRTEQDLAVRAAEAAAARVEHARRDVLRARAGALRGRVADLRAAVAQRTAVTDQLLARLREWEGVRYQPADGQDRGYMPLTLSAGALRAAEALESSAATLEQLAATGTADQVTRQLAAPMPEPSRFETAVLASRDTAGDTAGGPHTTEGGSGDRTEQ